MKCCLATAAAIAAMTVLTSFAGNPPSGQGYIMLGKDWNQPTRCVDSNVDSQSIDEGKVGSAVWQAVQDSGLWGYGYFGSSLTAPDGFYDTFPTMRRWYAYDAGADQSAADRAPYCPPNANYDYWIGGTALTTPNDNNVDAHYGPNHVYKFNGRSLTIDGDISHCSKGTSICDYGTNVTIKSGNYNFPALGTHSQIAVRMKAKVEGWFNINAGSGMPAGQRDCYVDISLTGAADKTVTFVQGTTYCATWYWCGDCSAYLGKLFLSGNNASESCHSILAISNVVCGGTVEIGPVQHLRMLGANAFVKKADIQPEAVFDLTPNQVSRVGTLKLDGRMAFSAPAGTLVVEDDFTVSSACSVSLDAGVTGDLLKIPSASAFTAEDFVMAVRRGGGTVASAYFRDNGDGSKTLVVSNPSAVPDHTVVVSQDSVIGSADENVRVNVRSGATLTLSGNSETRMAVNSEGGTINIRELFDDWSAIPSLWLDASAEETVTNVVIVYENSYTGYTAVNPLKTGTTYCDAAGNPFIKGWFDCRSTQQTVKLWNARYDGLYNGNHNVMPGTHPRRVLGGFNGKDYIACDRPTPNVRLDYANGTTVDSAAPDPKNLSRIYFTSCASAVTVENNLPQKPRYAFFVFGSQNGGGGSLLAGNANFVRGGTKAAHQASDPIFAGDTTAQVWIDGVAVNPKTSGFSGAWQVVTVDFGSNEQQFTGLGFGSAYNDDNGGQNYAEIILVDRELTERQRQTIEIYLAEKWGLEDQYAYPAWTKSQFATVYGTGTVNLETDATLGGAFQGTIDLKGKNLTIDGSALPPTEAAIDTADLEGWYDPDQAGKTTTQNGYAEYFTPDGVKHTQLKTPSPRMVNLRDKIREPKAGDALIYGQPARAPWLNDEPRGFGPVRKWMDFSNSMDPVPTNISNGCVLRFSHFDQNLACDNATYQQPMRTLFFVQDSVHGGGHPFADGANVNDPKLYKRRALGTAAVGQPIYPAGTADILTKGLTCLDGRAVDGLTESFGARPEVVTVVPTDTFNVVALGQLQNSENIKGGTTELLGEVMIYDRKLEEPERRVVEAYLSHKWLGIEQAGYSALTNATVTGAGTVTAASAALLPKFAAGFTGTVSVPFADGLDFALTTANATTSVVGAHDFGGGTLAATGDVTVRVAVDGRKPKAGSYKLLGWAAKPAATWSLEQVGWNRDLCTLRATDDGLYLDLKMLGMTLLVR